MMDEAEKKQFTNMVKDIEALNWTNDRLHELREIFVLKTFFDMAKRKRFAKYSISQVHIYNKQYRNYMTRYEVFIIFNNRDDSPNLRKEFRTFDEMESFFFGNNSEDPDLL